VADIKRAEWDDPSPRKHGGVDRARDGYATSSIPRLLQKELMPLRMRVHDREPIGMALRRFKKLLERSGMQKELRKRKYYEKPCEARRRAELRKQSNMRKAQSQNGFSGRSRRDAKP
jgi:small subunit ribosomal protein S21